MKFYLYTKGSDESFAELSAPKTYIGDDTAAFMKKKAQEYANIRKEAVVIRASGFDDAAASPK